MIHGVAYQPYIHDPEPEYETCDICGQENYKCEMTTCKATGQPICDECCNKCTDKCWEVRK